MKYPLFLLVNSVATFLLVTVPVRADFVPILTAEVTQQNFNQYSYTYTLSNTSASSLPIVNFNIAVDSSAVLQNITEPAGWLISYTPGDSLISWGAADSVDYIHAGDQEIFSFTSFNSPNSSEFSVVGFNPDDFIFGFYNGNTAAPTISAVPEHSSFEMIFIGIAVVLVTNYLKSKTLMLPKLFE